MSRANFVQSKLAATIPASATSLTIKSAGAAFALPPADGGLLTLTDSLAQPTAYEIVRYTSRSGAGPTFTLEGVTRAQEGTTAKAWAVDTFIFQSFTAAEVAQLEANIVKAAQAVGSLYATFLKFN